MILSFSGFEPELQLVTDDDSSSFLEKLLVGNDTGMNPEYVVDGIDGGGKGGIPVGGAPESSCILFRCLKNVCHMAAYDCVGGIPPAAPTPNGGGSGNPGGG